MGRESLILEEVHTNSKKEEASIMGCLAFKTVMKLLPGGIK